MLASDPVTCYKLPVLASGLKVISGLVICLSLSGHINSRHSERLPGRSLPPPVNMIIPACCRAHVETFMMSKLLITTTNCLNWMMSDTSL